jgi:putative transposon-encoded protein
MSRKEPEEVYFAKPVKFGNGAKLRSYKKHIGEEMVIMKRTKYEKFMKDVKNDRKVSDKEWDKNEKKMAEKWGKNAEPCDL